MPATGYFSPVQPQKAQRPRRRYLTESVARAGTTGSMTTLSLSLPNTLRVAAVLVACALPGRPTLAAERNACGCYQTDAGSCVCDKKARCGCPGLCEPQGCEQRREKVLQKEIDLETRKAREADRQHATIKDDGAPSAAASAPPRPARVITPVQTKELVRLLDLYFAAHPGARRETAGSLRDEIRPSPAAR
jgi:hypothetical protein